MPLYEYRCRKCGHRFEEIQSFSASHEAACPKCSGDGERLLSAPAFHLKGTGWYKTDYGSSSGSADGGSKSSDSKPSEPSPSTGTEGASSATPSPAPGSSSSEGSKKGE